MNMFKPSAAKTPSEYIELITDEKRKSDIKFLFDYIKKLMPNEKPNITSGMIGFGLYPYITKSGRSGDWPIILLASQKNYISLYVCSTDGKDYLAEKYKKDFPKASIGRSCIRFKRIEDIEVKNLEKLINEAQKTGFGFA